MAPIPTAKEIIEVMHSPTAADKELVEKAYHFVKNIALKNKLNLINAEQSQKGRILPNL